MLTSTSWPTCQCHQLSVLVVFIIEKKNEKTTLFTSVLDFDLLYIMIPSPTPVHDEEANVAQSLFKV